HGSLCGFLQRIAGGRFADYNDRGLRSSPFPEDADLAARVTGRKTPGERCCRSDEEGEGMRMNRPRSEDHQSDREDEAERRSTPEHHEGGAAGDEDRDRRQTGKW